MARDRNRDDASPEPAARGGQIPWFLRGFSGMAERWVHRMGESAGGSTAVRKLFGSLPAGVRKAAGIGISFAASAANFGNPALDEAAKEFFTGLGASLGRDGFIVTADFQRSLVERAKAAREAIENRRCRAVRKEDGRIFLHHLDCIKTEGGREAIYRIAMQQQGVGVADCCQPIFAAEEAACERLERQARNPVKALKSVDDIFGADPEAARILLAELMAVYSGDPALRAAMQRKIFDQLDRVSELSVVKYLTEAPARPAGADLGARVDAAVADPFGGAGDAAAEAHIPPRLIEIWAEFLGPSRANAVLFPNPANDPQGLRLRKAARFLRLVALHADGDQIKVLNRQLDSEDELDAVLICTSKAEFDVVVGELAEKSALRRFKERVGPAISATLEAAGPAKGALADVTVHVGSVLDEASAELNNLCNLADSIAAGH